MWARHLEISLGLWLVISPLVFRTPAGDVSAWVHPLACGALLGALALLSCWRPARRAHLAELPLAAYMLGAGWYMNVASEGELAAYQNLLVVGSLVAMLAIVPPDASRPPEAWRAEAA